MEYTLEIKTTQKHINEQSKYPVHKKTTYVI